MEKENLFIGKTMTTSIILSMMLILFGGSIYLFFNGHRVIHYQVFQQPTLTLTSMKGILSSLTSNPLAWIQSGLLMLIMSQIIRVGLITWLFIRMKDKCFTMISLIIFVILIYNLF